jgi:hypothetical protein
MLPCLAVRSLTVVDNVHLQIMGSKCKSSRKERHDKAGRCKRPRNALQAGMRAEINIRSAPALAFLVAISTAGAGEGAAAGTGTGAEAWTGCEAESLLTHEPGIVLHTSNLHAPQAYQWACWHCYWHTGTSIKPRCHHGAILRAVSMPLLKVQVCFE